VALPVPLTNELTAFAAQNPDFVDFDAARGLVKFKSDFTFDKGSAELRPEARATVDRLAGILNGPNASQYELMVVGHTDDQPVSNPVTIRNGHRDNWYLSAHRAISVSQRLMQVGINRQRMQVAGYADQRPLVPNTDESAKAKNRRVEVFILPTTSRRGSESVAGAAQTASGTGNGVRQAPRQGLNKDTTPPLPGLNKDTSGARTAELDVRPPANK
jgi:outer membrane protein OmpA-like peptidoglycan-associated protein